MMALFGKNRNTEPAEEPEEKLSAQPAEEQKPADKTQQPAAENPTPEFHAEPSGEPKTENRGTAGRAFQPLPDGFNFNRYFLAERRIMLENISYETNRPSAGAGQYKLGVVDTIVAQVIGQAGVKATFNRTLNFEPEGPFRLSVAFSVMLVFNPGTRDEIDWRSVDVAGAFRQNCPALVQTMAAKAALMVAEITAANGTPIIPVR